MAKFGPKGPRVVIDWKIFEGLCSIQCTQEEIASAFNTSVDTLERHVKKYYKKDFAEVFKQNRGKGNISLRRKSWQVGMDGNVRMLIHLTKNYLGMVDKTETKTELFGRDGAPITFIDLIKKLESDQIV